MTRIGNSAWCAFMNSKTRTGSCSSRTRSPPLPGSRHCLEALLAQAMVLTVEPAQLLALGAGRHAALARAGLTIRLANPMRDRLRVRLELTRQVLRASSRSDQLHHLPSELRWVGHSEPWHREHPLLKPRGVHETGSTPLQCPAGGQARGHERRERRRTRLRRSWRTVETACPSPNDARRWRRTGSVGSDAVRPAAGESRGGVG
jgi:hypothetical protein